MPRLSHYVAAIVLAAHALVHLAVWPGADSATPGERLRWNGDSGVLGFLPDTLVAIIGGALLAITVLGFAAAALGLFGLPHLEPRWRTLGMVASGASLALFALAWPGLEPHPEDWMFGPLVSAAILVAIAAHARFGAAHARQHAAGR